MVVTSSLSLRVSCHPGQYRVLDSEAWCTAAIAGTGGGKTVCGMVWLAKEMAANPGKLWVVAEPTLDMVDRVLLTSTVGRPSLPDFLGRFDKGQVFLQGKRILRNRLGVVVFATGEKPDTIQGSHIGGIWLDEAGLMKYEAWATAVQRVGFESGRILITTTPYNMGWLKTEVWDRWMDGDKDYEVIQFSSLANPKYPKEVYERARRTMSEARFRMMYEGEFGRPEGMIYDCFEASRHVVDDFGIPEGWERSGGLDFGFNNPTAGVFLAKDGDGVYYWYAEHYEREKTLNHHAAALAAKGGRSLDWYGDPSAEQQIAEMRRLGLSVVDGDNDVNAGIDTVYSLLAANRLKVFRSCKHGLDELQGYVWQRQKGGANFEDKPLKDRDHLMDGLRYALHTQEKRAGLRLFF